MGWFHLGDRRLTPGVANRIGPHSILSAATIWEVMVLLDKGRLVSSLSSEQTVRGWLKAAPMRVVPIDDEIAILSRTLPFAHDDPADRLIAATAVLCNVPLATADGRLQGMSWLSTVS